MYSVKQTANELGFSEGKVKSLLFRAREDLKKYLKKEGYFE
jgi:DNA-directed RNA polymerase specialized sigma24 family protein